MSTTDQGPVPEAPGGLPWGRPPLRIVVAVVVTVVALVVLAVGSLTDDGGDDVADTTTTAPPATTAPAPGPAVTTSIQIRPDWYPKSASRFSDREPVATVTTVSTTTTTVGTG